MWIPAFTLAWSIGSIALSASNRLYVAKITAPEYRIMMKKWTLTFLLRLFPRESRKTCHASWSNFLKQIIPRNSIRNASSRFSHWLALVSQSDLLFRFNDEGRVNRSLRYFRTIHNYHAIRLFVTKYLYKWIVSRCKVCNVFMHTYVAIILIIIASKSFLIKLYGYNRNRCT